jgi:hypothetical protein
MRLNWLMMRLMFGQSRACASAASFIRARDISSLSRTSTEVGAHRQRQLPRDLDRVVVELRAALRIELVAAVLEHFLGRRLARRPLAVKSAVSPGDTQNQTASESANVGALTNSCASRQTARCRRESRSRSAAAEESSTKQTWARVRDTIALRCEPLRTERRQRVDAAQRLAEAVDETIEERARRRERADRVQPPERDKGRVDATRQRQQALFQERAHTAALNRRLPATLETARRSSA